MKLGVIGIGNIMYSDEGVGVHFMHALQQNYKFTPNSPDDSIEFIDGGTLAALLMHILVEFDEILLIDCIDADEGSIGDVYFFDYEAMPKSVKWSGSAHEVEMLETLQMLDLCGDRPRTQILAVVPMRIEPMRFSVSDEVLKSSEIMERTAIDFIASRGFSCEKIGNLSVRDIAENFDSKGKN
ncbi:MULTISPECIES: HyaD/HybD family hydrogenase maturation endopeptidase [unclassified Campylobacter]|uniref:HyaD/HybD family hydrogenase maturation endopeptidase n=1 Tax=unclassified Campylobacter TaxID=2593542 RepID=UPI0022E9CE39|nr:MULTISPECIES: HyaD/HybD family hydrogenase maturation endopeptidase [unclassified Campylobacter]MDA3042662.1 HyaD/HybD family hydrogenase maturation endopeptidase [Campylobacter sp. JMF_09 ED2]MDA3044524.1 HyaD/HybD family hydrogenase maturation endopeptidase [Campylobacter sp. JMF_07 ED4]MDA3063353.1 HyaD/HybD family hydrogenase maturation endopeptidase [Campylobacter sp. JMF_11 EL3]MDA3071501.1 HyaD/HybD family hydrogenase maturation endopeptidase [Campylobacter sp. VBCF_03 NA9]MDA3074435